MATLRRKPAYLWLREHAERFGFYPYEREPWHWEYNPLAEGRVRRRASEFFDIDESEWDVAEERLFFQPGNKNEAGSAVLEEDLLDEALLDEEEFDEFSHEERDTFYIEGEKDAFPEDASYLQDESLIAKETWTAEGEQGRSYSLDEAIDLEEESTFDEEFVVEADQGFESESELPPSLPEQLSQAVRKGLFGAQVASTILSGERDENKLTNLIFLARHPARDPNERIKPHEKQLAREWLEIRDRIVRPILKTLAATLAQKQRTSKTRGTVIAGVERYRSLAESAAAKYGVDSALILGVIAAESGGNKDLVAESGYTGLMQAGKGEAHKQPAKSIDAGAKKLRDFRVIMEAVLKRRGQRYDRLPEAEQLRLLALAYNAGPVTVAKALQYAAEAGTPARWLEDEHYKRALLFTGAYSIRQASTACFKGVNPSEQPSRMREAMRIWNQWRLGTKKANWRKLEDPPPWPDVSKMLPPLVVCAINFKHRNSPKYAAKILAYRDRFQSGARYPVDTLRHESDQDEAARYLATVEEPMLLNHAGVDGENDQDLGEVPGDFTSGEHTGSTTNLEPAFEAGGKVSKTSRIRNNLQTQLGIIASMIAEGPDEALKRENEFTDVIYWQLHPERVRQRIRKSDPAYARLTRDWLDARDLLIRPLFGVVRTAPNAVPSLPTSHLEPHSIPSKSDVVQICRHYGDEVVARCKTKHRSDHCYIQRIRGEVACVDRILKRKSLTLEKLK